jgi:bla regulator protein BlaR1
MTPRKSVVIVAAAATLVIAMPPLALIGAPQSPAAAPWETAAGGKMAFEVASVKPTDSFRPPNFPLDAGDGFASMVDGRLGPPAGNRLAASYRLATYITFAYKLMLTQDQEQSMIARLPKWVSTDSFEILARAAGNPTKDQMRLMMQSLLADRFKLAVHFGTHQVPVLALTLIKPGMLGPNLRPHADGPPCDAPLAPPNFASLARGVGVFPPLCDVYMGIRTDNNNTKLGSRNTSMDFLASNLASFGRVGRPVVDQTGLSGRFDFTLEWTPESSGPQPAITDPQGPSFLEALREQLGLKLQSTEAPIQILVIDHVEKPDPN